ncbi:sigma-70 family RNA polymerase sigma factor [Paenibacillus helianthi]|uniref:sigma-70 family RNA polymerase sigma factor n=2 Tax=Paenibacillus TaxID=44249 RepID=UPI00093D8687|nr:sigma-70 family RNA polymerase sigma factor [Paenibacillus helianthi]
MSSYPEHIRNNLDYDKNFYSLTSMSNIDLAKRDSDFLGDLLILHETLIWHSVHKYIGKPEKLVQNYCVEKDDIVQLGRLGFIKAILAFDTGRGVKFSSYAVPSIVREVRCYLRDNAPIIRPTRTAHELMNQINIRTGNGSEEESVELLAKNLKKPEEQIKKAMLIGSRVKYLQEKVTDGSSIDSDPTYMDFLTSSDNTEEEATDSSYVKDIVASIQEHLSELELRVLQHRIAGLNQTQTAETENISQMRAGRIMKKVAELLLDSKLSVTLLDLDSLEVLNNYIDRSSSGSRQEHKK